MPTRAPLPLEYASPNAGGKWGKIFFIPSRLTLVFLMLLTLSIVWLAWRHEPWRMTAEISNDGNYANFPLVTPDGRLLCDNRSTGLTTVDLETGQVVTSIVPPSQNPNRHFIPIGDGDRVLDASGNGRTMTVYSTATGQPITELPNPQFLTSAYRPFEISSDTRRLLTGVYPNIFLWDLSGDKPEEEMKLIGFVGADNAKFTNDQKRIFAFRNSRVVILDANDGRMIYGANLAPKTVGLDLNSGTFGLADGAGPTELRSTWDASLLATYPPPVIKGAFHLSWSADLKLLFIQSHQPGISRTSVGFMHFDLVESASGILRKRITYPADRGFALFPDYRRYLLTTRQSVEIYDLNQGKPLAVLHPAGFGLGYAKIAPNGETLFILPSSTSAGGGNVLIYRRAGWDCPESTLGVLAFPSAWLLMYWLIAAALSLMRDARRQGDASMSPLPPWFLYPLWAISLVLTIHFTIEACLGVWIRSPAPLLLIAACGLATGSRAWRLIGLVLLALTLVWCCVSLNLLRQIQDDAYPLFDRVYELPHQLRMSALLATTAGIIAAIALLVIPRRLDFQRRN